MRPPHLLARGVARLQARGAQRVGVRQRAVVRIEAVQVLGVGVQNREVLLHKLVAYLAQAGEGREGWEGRRGGARRADHPGYRRPPSNAP